MATNRPRYTVSVDNELFEQIEIFDLNIGLIHAQKQP